MQSDTLSLRWGRRITVLIYINGELGLEEEARISVFDSGFNFADGVFEGIRVYNNRVFRLDEHIDRLFDSARAFELEVGMTREAFRSEVLRWLHVIGVPDDFPFRPIVTRGERRPP